MIVRRRRYVGRFEALPRGAHDVKVCRAQELRAAPTPAEAELWERLRRRQIRGWKFRRQHPVAGYIADFFCPSLALAIEVDGPIHEDRQQQDLVRSEHLARLGVTVLRFHNNEVLAEPSKVARQIAEVCDRLARSLNS